LFHKSGDGLGLKDLVQMETELTRREEAGRAAYLEKLARKGLLPPPPSPAETKAAPRKLPSGQDRKQKRQKPSRVKAPWKK
jgi:hypothetical protein